jgi:selenocysteine lyase/cysteine desulfurase
VEYVESLGWEAIVGYETQLGQRFLDGLPDAVDLYGLRTMEGRVPTFAFNLPGRTSEDVAIELAAREIAVWHGDYYAVEIMKLLGLEGTGAVRAGLVHYNTPDEVDRLLAALAELA